MAESAPGSVADTDNPKAVKDRNCPYCGQAFTSSSLGRHLDLYIKERNPKKPDGIHNVDEIRALRGNVTRRQVKAAGRRHTSTPAGTPMAFSKRGSVSDIESPAGISPSGLRDSRRLDAASAFLPNARREATGGSNEGPVRLPGGAGSEEFQPGAEGESAAVHIDSVGRPSVPSRAASRHIVKAQMDLRQRMQDAQDTSRAAELALKEFLSSWRAAKLQIDLESSPFEFDPLSMNFPALTLQCLRPPPTLFASTQHSAPSSWSIAPPGASEFENLKAFFQESFRKWKVTCAMATSTTVEEAAYPSSASKSQEKAAAIERAENRAVAQEAEINGHLDSTFAAWDSLSPERRNELWVLELARGLATKQTEVDKLRQSQQNLKQEVANLQAHVEQIRRSQQPREYSTAPPLTIPMGEKLLALMQENIITHHRADVGWDLSARNTDLNQLASVAIDRWKNAIVSARAANNGMAAQRPLERAVARNPMAASVPGSGGAMAPPASTAPGTPALGSPQPTWQPQQVAARSGTSNTPAAPAVMGAATGAASRRLVAENEPTQVASQQQQSTNTVPTGPLATAPVKAEPRAGEASEDEDEDDDEDEEEEEEEEMSDKDADAEMEDGDEFAHMHTPISRTPAVAGVPGAPLLAQQQVQGALKLEQPQQTRAQMKVARTRGPAQQSLSATAGAPNGLPNGQISMAQPMPNIATTMHGHAGGVHLMQQNDMGLAMQAMGGENMFID